jgi:hypothetical protein
VVGAAAALATADDATQEELPAGRAQFLNAQTAPFQVLVRAEPIDLEGHLRRVQARITELPEALREIGVDYLGFLPELAHSALCSNVTVTSCSVRAYNGIKSAPLRIRRGGGGNAERITDDSKLRRLAGLWKSKLDWPFEVHHGAFRDAARTRLRGATAEGACDWQR